MNTANLFSEHGHKVTILVLDETSASFYPVNPAVVISQQPLSFGITKEGNIMTRKIKMLSDVLKLRKVLTVLNAEILIATEYPFTAAALLSGARKKSKLFAWEHHHFHELKKNQFWNRVFYFTYPRLTGIICLNKDEEKYYTAINPNVYVIPNFISINPHQADTGSKTILTIARLNWVKGMDWAVAVAKGIFSRYPDWKWNIIGSGDLEGKIKTDISETHLDDNLELKRPQNHAVGREYEQASIFVLLSRNECFPMTLLEAQAAGLPCIAFDCETGPRHIIDNNENGLLVERENIEAMTGAINSLISDPEKRKVFGAHARNKVENFSPANIYHLWQEVLNKN